MVRAFFNEHRAHKVAYAESGSFFGIEDFEDWIEIEEK